MPRYFYFLFINSQNLNPCKHKLVCHPLDPKIQNFKILKPPIPIHQIAPHNPQTALLLFTVYCSQHWNTNPNHGFPPFVLYTNPIILFLIRNPSNPCYFQPFYHQNLSLIVKISMLARSGPGILSWILLCSPLSHIMFIILRN